MLISKAYHSHLHLSRGYFCPAWQNRTRRVTNQIDYWLSTQKKWLMVLFHMSWSEDLENQINSFLRMPPSMSLLQFIIMSRRLSTLRLILIFLVFVLIGLSHPLMVTVSGFAIVLFLKDLVTETDLSTRKRDIIYNKHQIFCHEYNSRKFLRQFDKLQSINFPNISVKKIKSAVITYCWMWHLLIVYKWSHRWYL